MRKGTALWLLAMIATAIPCAGGPRVAEPANDLPTASELTRIEAIVPAVTSELTRVVLRADAPMLYTSYEPDRTRLVIEIQDVDISSLPEVLEVEGDAVGAVHSTWQKKPGGSLARIEFTGLNVLSRSLRSEGTNLVVEFLPAPTMQPRGSFLEAVAEFHGAGTLNSHEETPVEEESISTVEPVDPPPVVGEAVPASDEDLAVAPEEPVVESDEALLEPEAPFVQAQPEPEPRPAPETATRLLGVEAEGGGDGVQEVVLWGDGALVYRTFTLENPDRLVFDLVGVRNTVGNRRVDLTDGAAERVRVAQFRDDPEPVARVVFDLLHQEPFEVVEDGQFLRVRIGVQEMASHESPVEPVPEPVPSPEPVMSEAPPVEEPAADVPVEVAPIVAAPLPADLPEEREVAPMETVALEIASVQEPAVEPQVVPEPQAPPAPIPVTPASLEPEPTPAPPIVNSPEPAPVEPPAGEVPLSLDEMGYPVGGEDDYVLFDQSAASPVDIMRASVPTQFQALTISGERPAYTGEKISVNFVEADLKNVFLFFADFIGLNIVIDPEVRGSLTMRLNQVPWDQAFDVILRHQGLEKVVEGNVVRIATTDKLRSEAAQRQALKRAQEAEVDPVTFTKVLSYAKVDQLMPILLQGVKTDRGKVVPDTRTNTLIITDVPEKREAYERLIDVLDMRTEQVMIEARIVETDRNFEHNLGVVWRFFGNADPLLGTQTGAQFPHRAAIGYDVNLPAPASAGTLGISLGNVLDSVTLDFALQAFENEGKVRILSSPKITTQNNQPAVIEQGTQIPVVTTTAVEINVQYISASLKLTVTPQITAEGTVIMDVDVENNSPDFVNRVGDVPPIITERATTQILVQDGRTAVIGGIFKSNESRAEAGVPGLRKIPGLGWLFKNRAITKQSTELLVFITPRILKAEA